MSYSDKSDILEAIDRKIVIQLTDDEQSGAIVDSRVTSAITKADNLIDGYLRASHDVDNNPILDPFKIVKQISVKIAIYNLYSRRNASEIPEHILYQYEEAKDQLEQIKNGNLLIDTPEADPNKSGFIRTNISPNNVIFTNSLLEKR